VKNIMTGAAVVNMELPIGLDMTGYIARESGSIGCNDELKIRCIVFDNGIECFAMITCDLLALDSKFIKETADLIEQQSQIPADKIMISCTHTHSGPASIHLQDCGEVNELWMNDLKVRISDCTKEAVKRLKPSTFSYKSGTCEIGKNRVTGIKGQSDTQIGVLMIRNADNGDMDTIIVNYACHAVVLGHTNLLYSKDFPHYMEAALKESYGAEVNIIFVNGCCGDINPIYRDGFDAAEKAGRQLSECIVNIKADMLSNTDFNDGEISMHTINVKIPFQHNLNEKDFEDLKASLREELEHESAEGGNTLQAKVYKAHIRWTDRMLEKIKINTLPDCISAELKLIKVGPLVMLAIPFEVFHGVGLRIKEYLGKYSTMIIGYANGDFGYFPSNELYPVANYEVKYAHRYYGYPGPLCENAEDILFNAITEYVNLQSHTVKHRNGRNL
jgi:neutral ceramidase